MIHQRALAHSGLAGDHKHPALAGPDGLQEPAEHLYFADPAPQGDGDLSRTE
jgi:hypothetical protein